jgi:hypothetical protein
MTELEKESTPKDHSFWFKLTLWAIYILVRLLSLTWRKRFVGMDRRRMAVAASPTGTFVIGSFHEYAFTGVLSHPNQNICNMVSKSKDGDMTDFLMKKLGLSTVRGSSSRGGKDVRDQMVAVIKNGMHGAITVDGPRGPRRVLKNGIVDIAKKTGAPILPLTSYGESAWVLRKAWDQSRIPKPFSKVLIYYGEPTFVPKDIESEQFAIYVSKITDILNKDDDLLRLRFKELWSTARPFSRG